MIWDIIILGAGVFAFVRGWSKGLLWAVVSLFAVLFAVMVSLKFSIVFSRYLNESGWIHSQWSLPVSYILIFLVIILFAKLLVRFMEKTLNVFFLGWINKLSGGILYTFFSWFMISSLVWLGNAVQVFPEGGKSASRMISFIEPIAPNIFEYSGNLFPFIQEIYNDINTFLDQVKQPV